MQELAKHEAQTWQEIENLLQSGYAAKNYEDVTALLSKLQELSEFQGKQIDFDNRLQALAEKYKGRTALVGRWKKKGWL